MENNNFLEKNDTFCTKYVDILKKLEVKFNKNGLLIK